MPRNPHKTPCSVDGCRAWAIRGSDPPLCAPHRARSERNALAYSEPTAAPALDPFGLESLDAIPGLDAELLRARLALHRVLDLLASDLASGPEPTALAPSDVIHLAELALRGAGTVSRLIRTHRELASTPSSGAIAAILALALREDDES